ncbi:MAG: sulfite exporter TauE/SafE family protein [Chryseolinea sp.]
MITALWITLVALGLWIAFLLIKDYIKYKNNLEANSWVKTGTIGFIGNFFDTLGIGSFSLETAMFKFFKQSDDRLIPGTLNVANAIPTIAQAIIFIQIVKVEPLTLVLMIAASGAGALLGAGVVARLPENGIRITMGIGLFVAACFMVSTNMNWIQGGGEALGLEGKTLAFAVAVNFVLGALMTAGIGLYAPCMALVFALGMSPQVAFPIMMGSCAFLMPVASLKFIKEGVYNKRASFIISITGTVAVLIAAYLVKSLPMEVLRWVVIVVILYTSVVMLRAAIRKRAS